jgi:hypothetical protein
MFGNKIRMNQIGGQLVFIPLSVNIQSFTAKIVTSLHGGGAPLHLWVHALY